jgi:hypothetical protein
VVVADRPCSLCPISRQMLTSRRLAFQRQVTCPKETETLQAIQIEGKSCSKFIPVCTNRSRRLQWRHGSGGRGEEYACESRSRRSRRGRRDCEGLGHHLGMPDHTERSHTTTSHALEEPVDGPTHTAGLPKDSGGSRARSPTLLFAFTLRALSLA